MNEHSQKIHLTDRPTWREWLKANHSKASSVWLIYNKKHTGKPRVSYEDAVEEALCFGWIDSTVRTIDNDRYMQKFTPRNNKSKWSRLNCQRCERLISSGLMSPAGLAKIKIAKQLGTWNTPPVEIDTATIPSEFETALKERPGAWENFIAFAPSYQKKYLQWYLVAKKKETRESRLVKIVECAIRNQKPGML